MTTLSHASDYSHAFTPSLSLAALRQRAPAAFAGEASPRTKQTYRFISTAEVLSALLEAGFEGCEAQQIRSRAGSDPTFARHMIRLRMARENLTLVDAIPNVVLMASHDGTTAWTMIAGLLRPICTNGLLCRMGDFGIIRVPHRKSIVTDVVAGALQIAAQFDRIGATVQAMAERVLTMNDQLDFARAAFEIRWAKVDTRPSFDPQKLLEVRRAADDHSTLWHVYNRCQEAAMAGGLHYQAANRRLVTTRKIRNIREDVRINSALWAAAVHILEA
jgi:hypothetical protein